MDTFWHNSSTALFSLNLKTQLIAGIWHEQSRSDRDNYLYIYKDNIKPGMEHNFGKKGQHSQYGQSVAYNYNSIMHYGKQLSTNLHVRVHNK